MSENTFAFNAVKAEPTKKITIVAARWNAELVDALVKSAKEHLTQIGFKNVAIVYVPGSWELVHASQNAIKDSDGVISFGVVIRGDTTHYELLSETVAQGLMQISIDAKKPLALGLIATEDLGKQSRDAILLL